MSPRAPTGGEGFSTMESASLLNPRTEHELQQSFGQSVVSDKGKDSGSPGGARQQLVADAHALSTLIKDGVAKKKSSIPSTWGEVYTVTEGLVPVLKTIRTYKKEYYYLDFVAGLVEGTMKVPQGMAYALLAQMPAQYGLYTSFMPPLMYWIFGTCQQMSFGVTAIESTLLGQAVDKIIGTTGHQNNKKAKQYDFDYRVIVTCFFTFCVGIWHLIFRIAKLSLLSELLSDPIISGFSTGAAFVIGTSQLSGWLGITLSPSNCMPRVWVEVLQHPHFWNKPSLYIGICSLVFLIIFKKVNTKVMPKLPLPGAAFVMIFSILVSWKLELNHKYKVKIVGKIPKGLPKPFFPDARIYAEAGIHDHHKLGHGWFSKLIGQSLLIAIITYVMVLALGKVIAERRRYKIVPKQELFAMFAGNTIGSLFRSFTSSASLSRTSVVHALNGQTVMHNGIAVLIMVLALTCLTEKLYHLPKAVLSSVIFAGLAGMIEFHEARRLFYTSKPDFLVWNVVFWVTLLFGAILGLAFSVGVAVLFVLFRSARPSSSVLGRLPGTSVYRDITRFEKAEETKGILVFRFDAPLTFISVNYFSDLLSNQLALRPGTHTVVIDASSINDIDPTSVRVLLSVVRELSLDGVSTLFANWKGPQRDMLERSGFYEQIPPETLFLTVHDAVVTAGKLEHKHIDGYPKADLGKSVALAIHDSDATVQETTRDGLRTWHVGARPAASSASTGSEGSPTGKAQ